MPQTEAPFKLLLFIDRRPSAAEQVRQIRQHLEQLQAGTVFGIAALETIDVTEHPYLAEHFKLVATPALVKVAADGHQTLAGRNLIPQLSHWWPRWLQEAQFQPDGGGHSDQTVNAVAQTGEILQLSDQIFRLNQAKAALELQLEFKDRIIAMMAHDLRNPLTAASIAIETMELVFDPQEQPTKPLKPELTAQLLRSAKAQIRTIDRMITDILQTARSSSAELQIQPRSLSLRAVCIEVIDSFQRRLKAKRQAVSADLPQDLPSVHADPVQIRRVIVNLMENAIKYTPEAGTIAISALHRTSQKVQISIRDTGPGIPAENQQRIFEERFRLQRDRAQDGYGLGLALCQRIVRAHYGQIWVDSKPDTGSCFHFTLPVYRE